jgi:hypothetical protein
MNGSMAFHVGIAYGIAFLAVAGLACLGARNRRSGWQKPATNDVLDILIAWAQAKEENRQSRQRPPADMPATARTTPDMGVELGALSAALTMNAGVTPPAAPSHQTEKQAPAAAQIHREVVR